jgi:hypothetical protein
MSYNGSGLFQINTSGQPVVAGTVITASAFNALTADLATGLTTAITKDGQTATTAQIPFAQGLRSTLVTDSTTSTSGSIITDGGLGVAKAITAGTTITGTKLIPTGTSVTGNGMYLPAANTLGFSTNGANAVTIDSAQNVTFAKGFTVGATAAPAFSAYRSGANQTVTTNTVTKVQLNFEEFDTNSNFDNVTNYRFTPTVAGYYQISGAVGLNGTNTRIYCSIYKNGSEYFRGIDSSVNLSQVNVSALVYFNGSTDYIELYVLGVFSGTSDVPSGQKYVYLTGAMVRSA